MEFLKLLEGIRTPFGNILFQLVTLLGEETLFMIIAMTFFWCIDKKKGFFLLYVNLFGTTLNQLLKMACRVPRPWVRDPSFTIVESAREAATGYSFPSGHTQSVAGLFGSIARFQSCPWLRAGCVAAILLTAFSRMYLGVHTPSDVLVSLGIAAVLVLVLWPLFERYWDDPRGSAQLQSGLVLFCIGVVLYAELSRAASPADETLAKGVKAAYQMLGTSLGIALVRWIDGRYMHFNPAAPLPLQIFKVAVGLGLILAVRLALNAPLLTLTGGHESAHGIRYLLMTATGGALWPLAFPALNRLYAKLLPAKEESL